MTWIGLIAGGHTDINLSETSTSHSSCEKYKRVKRTVPPINKY